MRNTRSTLRPAARLRTRLLTGLATVALAAGSASASGFAVSEQSVRGLGRAYSGETALGGDASSLWYNPALAAFEDRPVATTGVLGIFANGELNNTGTTIRGPGTLGNTLPVGGPNADDPLDIAGVPNASFILPVGDGVALGLNVNVPFGLVVDYDYDYFGRYDSVLTKLYTANIQGSVAYKVSDQFAIGVGIDAQYAKARLDSLLPNLGPLPDGKLSIEGDHWAWGWNAGFVWRPVQELSIGAHYRSSIEHELEGSEVISGLVGPLAGVNRSVAGNAGLDTPAIASLGIAYQVTPDWTLTVQGNWYEWSRFEEIRVTSPGLPDLVNAQNYKDSYAFAAGVAYRINPEWTWRAGVMAEETPTQGGYRSTRVPDADRLWLATGATWNVTEHAALDASIAYVMLDDAHVSRTDILYEGTPAATEVDLNADSSGDAVIVGLGGSWTF